MILKLWVYRHLCYHAHMGIYKKESLETLREKVYLPELISSYAQVKKQGGIHKALCPFHEEKTPSFTIHPHHYHCFGCGAHGDGIAFLMQHLKVSFVQAVEILAERFAVALEKGEAGEDQEAVDKVALKGALDLARRFYKVVLRNSEEGKEALAYLKKRGIDGAFIEAFDIGYAPSHKQGFLKVAKGAGLDPKVLYAAGLITEKETDFFSERVMFPIKDLFGTTIGFSGRKIKEKTFGGKYINSPETKLFKKSKVLFGIKESRQRIAKEKKALIVEGQIDALRLIHEGLNFTVAAQGTAFGQEHVKALVDLGVTKVFLAMDGDDAGAQATLKIGHLFQQVGVAVVVASLPQGSDPDSFVRNDGIATFSRLLEEGKEYLQTLVTTFSQGKDLSNPSEKSEVARKIAQEVRSWNDPILVYESLRKVAQLLSIPEELLGISRGMAVPMMKRVKQQTQQIDPHRFVEMDMIRWMLLVKDPELLRLVPRNLGGGFFFHEGCKKIFEYLLERLRRGEELDLISLATLFEKEEEGQIVTELMQKKVNLSKANEEMIKTIEQLLTRSWMHEREQIRMKIQSGLSSEEEVLSLAKRFDEIRKQQPQVQL